MNTAVIDADHIFYLSLTGEKLLDENNEPIKVDNRFVYRERTFEESCKVADNYITDILNKSNAYSYIGFFGGSSQYRKNIYFDYKANRKDLEPLKNLIEMKHYLKDKWNFYWINVKIVNNVHETDDYVVSYYRQNKDTSFIISPDKDLLNIEGKHFNPKKNEWTYVTSQDEYKYLFSSMIIGDTSDNIPGLKGKGESFVKKLFEGTTNYPEKVLSAYISHYGEINLAMDEYFRIYKCLKLLDDLNVSEFTTNVWNNTIIE
jgi:5'-3' exonuclease